MYEAKKLFKSWYLNNLMKKTHFNNQVKTVAQQLPSCSLWDPKDGRFGICWGGLDIQKLL